MSYLNIQLNVELTYKPIFKPMNSELLALSLANSDLKEDIYNFYFGRISRKEIEEKLDKAVTFNYLIVIGDKKVGNEKIKLGEEKTFPILIQNKKITVRVMV